MVFLKNSSLGTQNRLNFTLVNSCEVKGTESQKLNSIIFRLTRCHINEHSQLLYTNIRSKYGTLNCYLSLAYNSFILKGSNNELTEQKLKLDVRVVYHHLHVKLYIAVPTCIFSFIETNKIK